MIIEACRVRLMMTACWSVTSSMTSWKSTLGPSWSAGDASEPLEDGLARPAYVVQVAAVHLQHAELPLDEQDSRLHLGHRPQRQIDDPLDRECRLPPRR